MTLISVVTRTIVNQSSALLPGHGLHNSIKGLHKKVVDIICFLWYILYRKRKEIKKMFPIYLILVAVGVVFFSAGYIGQIVDELIEEKNRRNR